MRVDSLSQVKLTGTQLIEASAGTGKTHAITTLYLRLLLERQLAPEQILVVTFTKAATAELRQRLRRRLSAAVRAFETGRVECQAGKVEDSELEQLLLASGDRARDHAHLRTALGLLDQLAVFTIHGFCQRMLDEYAFESGERFDVELLTDQEPLIREVVQDFYVEELSRATPAKLRYLRQRGVGLSALVSLGRISTAFPDFEIEAAPVAEPVEPALEQYLRARFRLRGALHRDGEIAERLLLESKGLNRQRYREAKVREWFERLRALVSREEHDLGGWFEELERLSSERVRAAGTQRGPAPEHSFFDECSLLCGAHRAACESLDGWVADFQRRSMRFCQKELARRKRERGVLSYDDLLHKLRDALITPAGAELSRRILERFPAALIDEFQDTDPVQYQIFRKLYARPRAALFLIGDPKQAIYAFRGADIFTYLEAARDAENETHTLATSYRSDPGLVRAHNTLFSRARNPFVFARIAYHEVQARPGATDQLRAGTVPLSPFRIQFLPRTGIVESNRSISKRWALENLPPLVAAEVSRFLRRTITLNDAPLLPRDLAVLTRTNRQALEIQRELRRLRIPSVLHGDASVLDSEEARELGLVMRALSEPGNPRALKTALFTTLFGLNANELAVLNDDEAAWEVWVDRFRAWHQIWEERGFVQALGAVMREHDVMPRVLALGDGERRMTNYRHLFELLHQAELEERLGVAGLMSHFSQVRFDQHARESMAPDSQQLRLESDEHAVVLTTMHKSKGLEFNVVFCPYLWDGLLLFDADRRVTRFHDPDDPKRLRLDLRPAHAEKQGVLAYAEREARAEQLRLTYVALTRARHHVSVLWGVFKNADTSGLAHLMHQGPLDAEMLGQTADQRVRSRGDRELLNDLAGLAQAAGGAIEVETLEVAPGLEYQPPAPKADVELKARVWTRTPELSLRTTSFTALTSSAAMQGPSAREGHDRDEPVPGDEAPATELPGRVRLWALPRGARTGNLLHELFEELDFEDTRELDARVAAALRRRGFDVELFAKPLADAVRDVLRARLESAFGAFQLADIAGSRRLSELEFTFPVLPGLGDRLSAVALGRVFAARSAAPWPADYPGRVGRLGFRPLRGFLRGFIDLVFEHDGRFYLVDYKSNHLGNAPEDYAPERLSAAMAGHHYFLQYHLYAVALHRFLEARKADYDFARHFGGVFYLFLRGMERSGTAGVFFDRPPRDSILGLSQVFSAARDRSPDGVEASGRV